MSILKSSLEEITTNPKNHGAYYSIGMVHYSRQDIPNAIKSMKEAVRLLPNSIQYQFQLGVLLLESGKNKEAFEEFKKAVKSNPKKSPGYLGKGLIFYIQKNYKAASSEFMQAIKYEKAPEAENHFMLAHSLYKQGDSKQSISELKKAANMGYFFKKAYLDLADILEYTGNKEDAKNILLEYMKENQDSDISKRLNKLSK